MDVQCTFEKICQVIILAKLSQVKLFSPEDGKITYLVSEVEVNKNQWISRDRGYDPKNDQQIWGSEHGKLVFKRIESYSNQIKVAIQ